MTVFLTQFGAASSGIGALGINGTALIIQIVTFLLAFWALQHWAFKPIIKLMNERHKTIEKGVKLGQEMEQEKAALENKVAETLHKARSEADGIVAEAKSEARQVVQEAEDEARTKAENLIKEADEKIEQNMARAWKEMEKEFVGLVSDATEVIVGEKVDAKKDASLMDRALKGRS